MSLEQILAGAGVVDTARRLAAIVRLTEQRAKFDAQVAAALGRLALTKQLRRRIKGVAND